MNHSSWLDEGKRTLGLCRRWKLGAEPFQLPRQLCLQNRVGQQEWLFGDGDPGFAGHKYKRPGKFPEGVADKLAVQVAVRLKDIFPGHLGLFPVGMLELA